VLYVVLIETMTNDQLKRMQRVAIGLLGVLALLSGHLFVRAWNWKRFILENFEKPLFVGSDSYYHAHRISRIYETFPKIEFHDSFMAYPSGTIAQWPFGYDYFTAAILSIGRMFGLHWSDKMWALPFVNVAFSIVTVALFYKLISYYLIPVSAWFFTMCFSVCIAFIGVSSVGLLDHHGHETIGVILLMLTPRLVSKNGSNTSTIAVSIALAVMIWCTTLMAYLASAFFVIWLFVEICAKVPRVPHHLKTLLISLGSSLFAVCVIESFSRGLFISTNTLSLLHFFTVIAPIFGMLLLERLKPAVIVSSVFALGIILVVSMPSAAAWIISFVLGNNSFIGNVSESKPIFMTKTGPTFLYIHAYFGIVYLLFPVMFLMVRRTVKLREVITSPVLWFSLFLFLLSFSQKRFAHLFSPGLVFVTGIWASSVARRFTSKRYLHAAITCLAVVLLIEPIIYFNKDSIHLDIAIFNKLFYI